MANEQRTAAVYVKIRPSLRAAIDVDLQAKGQTIQVWAERAFMTRLGMDEAFDMVEETRSV